MECQAFGADSLLIEIGAVVMHTVDEGRSALDSGRRRRRDRPRLCDLLRQARFQH